MEGSLPQWVLSRLGFLVRLIKPRAIRRSAACSIYKYNLTVYTIRVNTAFQPRTDHQEAPSMATLLPEPPWDYLCQASKPSLQGFELSRLNHAALIREQISALLDEWIEENSAALLARWLLNQSERLRRSTTSAPLRHPAHDLFAAPAPELPAPPNAHPAVVVPAPLLPAQPSTPTSAHAADPLPDTIRGP